MSTSLDRVEEILTMLKSRVEVFQDKTIPVTYCKFGVIQASIALGKDFDMVEQQVPDGNGGTTDKIFITSAITDKEIYLAGLYAYRNYALNMHDEYSKKAINFKTISFAVSGLTERAKEIQRIVWWCDGEIKSVLDKMTSAYGTASEMVGDGYE